MEKVAYTQAEFCDALPEIVALASNASNLDEFRVALLKLCDEQELAPPTALHHQDAGRWIRVRDCARMLRLMLSPRAEALAQFSFAQALFDLGSGITRADLTQAFIADAQNMLKGLFDRGKWNSLNDVYLIPTDLEGRAAALARSRQLDELSANIALRLGCYAHGLEAASVERRKARRQHICHILGASEEQFADWRWQVANVQRELAMIERLAVLTAAEREAVAAARKQQLPFGITPYYLSLMDDDPAQGRDRAIRAQVLPPPAYVTAVSARGGDLSHLDFMLEGDTSPIDLITRRYPSICILKPYNTCPQICVYCQRNWEIEDAMAPDALASPEQIKNAIAWIAAHPAIKEVLITGGDPLAMEDAQWRELLDGLAEIESIERIRIGSRMPVTVPTRITEELADLLASYRIPGRRQVALVTHIEHPYEVTPEMMQAVERLRLRGIGVFNQLVYTFFISRRFEAALLRQLLSSIGVEPYYTFNTKGKEETDDYRVPLARLLQEQKEEARTLPGLTRTDEGVYNVPGHGKNYLRARQHRDLVSLLPNGSRLYEFHPWEKNVTQMQHTYLGSDVPILDYLQRLEKMGENLEDYDTIWYYY